MDRSQTLLWGSSPLQFTQSLDQKLQCHAQLQPLQDMASSGSAILASSTIQSLWLQ